MAAPPAGIGYALTKTHVGGREGRALSMFENLPTEIIQQMANYLARRDDAMHYKTWDGSHEHRFAGLGLRNLRETWQTMRAKSEHIFAKCMAVKIVVFDRTCLRSLVILSASVYSGHVKDIVFTATYDRKDRKSADDVDQGLNLALLLQNEEMHGSHTPEVISMITAFQGFANLNTIVIGNEPLGSYPASVRQRSLAKHPPSMNLSAAVLGASMSLEHIYMGERPTGTFDGVKPRTLNVLVNNLDNVYRCGYLKTLGLVLKSHNGKLPP